MNGFSCFSSFEGVFTPLPKPSSPQVSSRPAEDLPPSQPEDFYEAEAAPGGDGDGLETQRWMRVRKSRWMQRWDEPGVLLDFFFIFGLTKMICGVYFWFLEQILVVDVDVTCVSW